MRPCNKGQTLLSAGTYLECFTPSHMAFHLELLEWSDEINFSALGWHVILTSPIRHLKLFRVHYDDSILQGIRELPPVLNERLEKLDIELWKSFGRGEVTASSYDVVIEVLNRYPALKTLVWNNILFHDDKPRDNESKLGKVCHLRSLSVRGINFASVGVISALVGDRAESGLEHLTLAVADKHTLTHLATLGKIPSLKRVACMASSDPPVGLLEENTQSELLSLENCTAGFVDTAALPLVAASYKNLQSLELVYKAEHIALSEAATSSISHLKSLVKPHLSVGHQFGWRRTWVVDHKTIRNYIKHLPALKILALSRDTYGWGRTNRPEVGERYDEMPSLTKPRGYTEWRLWDSQFVRDNSEDEENWEENYENRQALREFVFEMLHRRRMLQQARKYVNLRRGAFVDGNYQHDGPKLDFINIGELPIRVRRGWYYGWRPLAASERRDDLWTFLRRTLQNVRDLFDD